MIGVQDLPNQDDTSGTLKLADRVTLSLLSELEGDVHATQRGLAQRVGAALGMTNSLLKRAVHKGLVKVTQAPAKRFAYYVTPKGFAEKSRLVAQYLSCSLDFFRQAREQYASIYDVALSHGHTRVALFGMSELAEIATLSAHGSAIEVLALIQPGSNQAQFSGLPVINSLDVAQDHEIDAIIITNSDAPQNTYELLREYYGDAQIYTVPLLQILRRKPAEEKP